MAKTKTIGSLFLHIALYSELLPIVCFIVYLSKSKAKLGLTIVFYYCLYDFLLNFAFTLPLNNSIKIFLLSSFTLIEFILFSSFFYITTTSGKFRRLIILATVIFSIFTVIYFFFGVQNRIDSIPIGIESVLMILFSFYFLYDQVNNIQNTFIYNNYIFWIVLGIMIYLSGSFFIYLYASQSKEAINYWFVTDIFMAIKDLFFAIAILINASVKAHRVLNKQRMSYR